jgi:hypothetical protein
MNLGLSPRLFFVSGYAVLTHPATRRLQEKKHMDKPQEDVNIACNMGAIVPDERMAHATKAEGVFQAVLEIKEIPDGYAFRLPLEDAMLIQAAEWMAKERLCCSFFRFRLLLSDSLWLEIAGTEEVKAYIGEIMVKPLQNTGSLPDKEEWIVKHS